MRIVTTVFIVATLLYSCRVDNDDLFQEQKPRSEQAEGRNVGESEPVIPILVERDPEGFSNDEAGYTMQMQETSMRSTYSLDTENLSYRFAYLSFDQSEKINFEDGKATIRLSGLPTNRSGTVIMEISEGGKVKLRAKKDDVTLKVGSNALELHMLPVEGEQDEQDGDSENGESPVTYADVRSIFTQSCVSCHGSQGGLSLANFPFQSSKLNGQQAIVTKIIEVVSGAQASMPPSPAQKLSANDIEKLQKWLSGGLQN